MPENTLSFPGATGDAYDLYIERNGQLWNGSAMAVILDANWTTYALAFVEQGMTGTFNRAIPPTLPAAPKYGFVVRKRAGGSAAPTDKIQGAVSASWDGTDLGADVAAVKSDTGTIVAAGGGIPVIEVVVDDAAPRTDSFLIAMADGSDVPLTFVWRGKLANFAKDSPTLPGGSFGFTTYVWQSAKKAKLTFVPALPAAPTDGEAIQVL